MASTGTKSGQQQPSGTQQLSHRSVAERSSIPQIHLADRVATITPLTASSSKDLSDAPGTGGGISASSTLVASHEDDMPEQDNDQPQSQPTNVIRRDQSKPHVVEWLCPNLLTILFGLTTLAFTIVFGVYAIYSWNESKKSYAQDMRSLKLSFWSACKDDPVESRFFSLPFPTLQ
ncbi:MAG: hypothetical protein M1840_000752 [Geoglossum simile]|nr:MAG: hypothetical protein M1840_000752 [Geoglossum simile]